VEKAPRRRGSGRGPGGTGPARLSAAVSRLAGCGPSPTVTDSVYVRLPLATCPACNRTLGHGAAATPTKHSPTCGPFCFERLRPCPVCGAPNSWLARRCVLDPQHVVRSVPDWPVTPGGAPDHGGCRAGTTTSPRNAPTRPGAPRPGRPCPGAGRFRRSRPRRTMRRWRGARRSPPTAWSPPPPPPRTAMPTSTRSTRPAGRRSGIPTRCRTGVPERGGVAIAAGEAFRGDGGGRPRLPGRAAGTRLWETKLDDGRVYGAVVPAGEDGRCSSGRNFGRRGCLYAVDLASGGVTGRTPLDGRPTPPRRRPRAPRSSTTTPAPSPRRTSPERGILGRFRMASASTPPRWSDRTACTRRPRTARVLPRSGHRRRGMAGRRHQRRVRGNAGARRGALYVPADDGVHLVSAAGRPVRRYG
jgi:hypothetical protein